MLQSKTIIDRSFYWHHLFAMLTIIGAVAYLEIFETNYFNQDDNFAQFGPIIIGACRSLFDQGIFPFWTPYQNMGGEVLQSGIYSLTYPPTYVAYAIARYVFHDEAFWTTAYFSLHAIAAYWVINYLLKGLKISSALRAAAALSFIFIGYNLVAGRSWYYMIPVMVWLPALLLGIIYRQQWSRRSWILTSGFCIGVFYHAGNLQMWVYALLFWLIAWGHLFYGLQPLARRQLVTDTMLAALLAFAIALPLLVPQFVFLKTVGRAFGAPSGSIHFATLGWLMFPYPLVQSNVLHGYAEDCWPGYAGHVYYGSLFFMPLALWALCGCAFASEKKSQSLFADQLLWLALALIAFLCALGNPGLLWFLMAKLPVFDKFAHPFKFLPYLHFFLILSGVVLLDKLVAWYVQPVNRKLVANGVLIVCAIFAFYSAAVAKDAFWNYGDRDYPPLPPDLAAELSPTQRSISFAPSRSSQTNYVWALSHNFPTIYSDYTFGFDGYDQFSGKTPEMWLLMKYFARNKSERMEEFGIRDVVHFDKSQNVTISHLPNPKPLVYYQDTGHAIPFRVDWQGITLGDGQTDLAAGNIVVNFLFRPGFGVQADDNHIGLTADPHARMLLTLPAPVKSIRLAYDPPYLRAGGVLSVLMLVVFWVIMFRNGRMLHGGRC